MSKNIIGTPLMREEIFQIVCNQIVEVFYCDINEIVETSRFEEDLSCEQFLLQDCFDNIEEELCEYGYSIKLEKQERLECESVKNLIDLIMQHSNSNTEW